MKDVSNIKFTKQPVEWSSNKETYKWEINKSTVTINDSKKLFTRTIP